MKRDARARSLFVGNCVARRRRVTGAGDPDIRGAGGRDTLVASRAQEQHRVVSRVWRRASERIETWKNSDRENSKRTNDKIHARNSHPTRLLSFIAVRCVAVQHGDLDFDAPARRQKR